MEALRLYCVTPFGRIHSRNPDIVALAESLGRSPSALALKMVNFASLDPTIDQTGMANVSNLDREVWNTFFEGLINAESDEDSSRSGFSEPAGIPFEHRDLEGFNVPVAADRRVNQDYFRGLILASYDGKCAATGIDAPELLVAGHIIPWSADAGLRTSAANGICLNNLFDKAFDRGLIAIGSECEIIYSSRLPNRTVRVMKGMASEKISLPRRFRPNMEYFAIHRRDYFA